MITYDEKIEKVVVYLHQSILSMEKAYDVVKARQTGLVSDKQSQLRSQDYLISLEALKKAHCQLRSAFSYKNAEVTLPVPVA